MKKLTLKDLYKNKKVRVLDKTRGGKFIIDETTRLNIKGWMQPLIQGYGYIKSWNGYEISIAYDLTTQLRGSYDIDDIREFEQQQLELFDDN